jgi:hypothetical protein
MIRPSQIDESSYSSSNVHVIHQAMLFIKQCRVHLAIRTHPFTCAAYYPFEVIALDHIGPLIIDEKGHQYVLVIIDAFSRWVELYPTKGVTADETPERILTDRGTAFHNERTSQ